MAIGENAGLLFKIKADESDAVRGLNNVKGGAAELTGAAQGLSGSLAAIAGPAGIALAGVTAIAGAALAATKQLFDLATQAAEFGSEIFDASAKTGLGAEALSALKFAAEQSGSTFEQVTKGITSFAVVIGEAARGSDKAREKLDALGVTSTDLDEALEQVFRTIADAKNPTDQLALATAAFGKKIGPDLIPLIKDADGNFKGLIQRAKDLGVTIDDEAAAAADAFGDQMDLLNTQLSGVARTIGFEVMPIFLEWATNLSEWLVRNKNEISAWANGFARAIEFVVKTILNNVDAFVGLAQILSAIASYDWTLASQGVQRISAAITAQKGAWENLTTADRGPQAGGGRGVAPTGLPDEEDKRAAEKRAKEREELAKRDAAAQIAILKNQLQQSLEAYDSYQKQLEAKIKEGQFAGAGATGTARGIALNTELDQILPALEAAENAQAQSLKKTANEVILIKQEQNERIDDINKKQADAQARLNSAISEAEKKAAKDSVDTAKKSAEDKLAIRRADTDRQLAQFELELQRKYLSEVNYIRAVGLARLSLLEIERNNETDKTKQAVLDAKIAEQKLKNIKDIEAAETAAHEKRRERWNEYVQNLIKIQELEDKEAERKANEERQRTLNTTVGSGFEISAIQQLNDYFAGEGNTAALAGIEAITQAFEGLANAVGQAVQAYVLYGSAGASVRQVTAQILAAIAQQAAIKAIFELAEGFAALAMSFFGIPNAGPSAAAHFAAAAIYGSIAAVAAVAGRAVAGDSFKKQASGGGSGSGSSGGDRDDSPLSRQSGRAFESRREGTVFQRAADAMDRAALAMVESSQSVKETMGPLRPMSPGDVLAAGAEENRGFLASTVAREIESNAGYGTRLRRAQGI